jgi:K+-sensing histidine kinase KdpD
VGLVVLSTFLRFLLEPYLGKVVFLTYFPAVMLAGWLGGFWPGFLATVLSTVAADYFRVDPGRGFALRPTDLAQLGFFFLCGLQERLVKEYILEANVLVHFLTKDQPHQASAAAALLHEAEAGEACLHLDPVIIAEALHVLTAYYKVPKASVACVWHSLWSNCWWCWRLSLSW